jgi:signal transduction histidine kinase
VRRWWSEQGLRARLMIVGTSGIVAGLAIGSIAIVLAMSYALQRSVDSAADATASSIAASIADDGQVSSPLPVPANQVAQVLDIDRRVLAGSGNADLLVPLLRPNELQAALGGERVEINGDRGMSDQSLRVTARYAGSAANRQIVIVAVPVGDFNNAVHFLRSALFLTLPLLVLVLVAVGWRVVGAALAPVEQLRAGAVRITGSATSERLPVPPTRDEIQRLAVTLNDMLDRLTRGRLRQRAFVADAAHELRSPLTSMRIQLEVAQKLGDWANVGDDLILDIERLSRLVDDLLLLARADEGVHRGAVGPVDLRGLIADVAARYDAARVPVSVLPSEPAVPPGPTRSSGLAVSAGPPASSVFPRGAEDSSAFPGGADDEESLDGLWAEGDPDALLRVFVNLVDNAVRHARTKVVLAVVPEGEGALLTVTDDGRGIAVSDRKRVFDRFTRLDDARARDAGGAGLGLAIVQELVRRHGGTIVLQDAAPGVRAEVRLPLITS